MPTGDLFGILGLWFAGLPIESQGYVSATAIVDDCPAAPYAPPLQESIHYMEPLPQGNLPEAG